MVKDGEVPVSIIGKMLDITRTKQSQERLRLRNLEDMRKNANRGNSLYNQVLAESERFQETEFVNLADGHRFLAQIMEDVKYVDNLVDGMAGKGGGYRLNRPAEEYVVGHILRLTEGDLAPVACLGCEAERCDRADNCKTLPMWEKYNDMTNRYFDSITVADLLKNGTAAE